MRVSDILVTIIFCSHVNRNLYFSLYSQTVYNGVFIMLSLSVIFLIVSFSIYGALRNGLDWSYALSVSGTILFFIAGVLGLVRWREINQDITLEVQPLSMEY